MEFKQMKQVFIDMINQETKDGFFVNNEKSIKIKHDIQLLQQINNPRQLLGYIYMSSIAYGSLSNYILNTYGIKLTNKQKNKLINFQNKLKQYITKNYSDYLV